MDRKLKIEGQRLIPKSFLCILICRWRERPIIQKDLTILSKTHFKLVSTPGSWKRSGFAERRIDAVNGHFLQPKADRPLHLHHSQR